MLKEKILNAIEDVRNGKLFSEVKEYSPVEKRNEALFFFKPEVLKPRVDFGKILEITLDKFSEFGVSIESACVFSGEYLKKYEIMAKHYGVINRIAREGKSAVSPAAKKKFREFFGEDIERAPVLGAFQFLEKYPEFNEFSLYVLWENLEMKRLASGTSCEKIRIGENFMYVLNGFHPYQLLHFTAGDSLIVVMAVVSDSSWKGLRREMLGATDPLHAEEGSLRRILLEKKKEFNLPEVSQGYNGMHLSAGPVEALAELLRFCSNYETGKVLSIGDTAIGRKFLEAFSEEAVKEMLQNPKIKINGREESVFDLTEEMDVEEAIETLKKFYA